MEISKNILSSKNSNCLKFTIVAMATVGIVIFLCRIRIFSVFCAHVANKTNVFRPRFYVLRIVGGLCDSRRNLPVHVGGD